MTISSNLQLRLFVPFAVVLVIAMSSAWWIASSLMSRALERNLDQRLNQAVSVLSEDTFPITEELVTRLGALLNADLAFFSPDGELRLSTTNGSGFDVGPLQERLREPGESTSSSVFEIDGYRVLVRRSIRDPRFSAVAAIASTDDVRAAARDTAFWLGVASLLATVLLAVAAHFFVRSIVGPIAELSDMAARVAKGDRNIAVAVSRDDEIGALTSALNAMAQNLADYEAELAVQARMSALGEMSARIAHEIRNPLTAIKLKLQVLAESLAGEDRADIETVLHEIGRLELIVTSALSVARPVDIAPAPAELNRVVEEVVGLVAPQLAHQSVRLEFAPEPLPAAALDEARIKQVLFNLINNAAAAMPGGGTLRITTAEAEAADALIMDIEDSGPGIPEAERAALFETGRTSQGFGLGLGLRLCQEIVHAHGGTITVTRSATLGGACFRIVLPLERQA